MRKIIIVIETLLLIGFGRSMGFAQAMLVDSTLTDTLPAYDNLIKSADLGKARPFPYPKTNPANIRLYAQVWRDIDLADTGNSILMIPGKSLMEDIMKGIKAGKLTPYEKEDFKKKLTAKQGELRFADSVLIPIFDKDGNQISSRMALNEFNPDKVRRFRIKEDVFFDRQRGRVDTRIVALAPMMRISTTTDLADNLAFTPAFWLYFPQLRYTLVQEDVSNPDKDIFDFTMDDVFMQHKFSAYLVKQASPSGVQSGQLEPGSTEALMLEQKIADLKKHIWQNPKGINAKNLVKTDSKKEDKL
ncbi:gliding motility protein GldN [Mucilaginibacter sp. FT3.2]|uniref:type IX secretion system ring protein PorN/GldN n=1 Tax=Mucilaginibacter sp. FT3.2 TaxID=2723090 RepID=UPI00161E66B2|nr:gliding motility protein GldN [Mucilaginibacter sp. FT3.2]MBB6232103.1 gliding motility associated protein GldN [Mucilaginibacter sp. FT3.2]